MKEECLICKAPLEYLVQDELMECAICHKQERSKTRCVEGHYVCSDCHTQGMDSIFGLCLSETSRDPIAILEKMMAMPFCRPTSRRWMWSSPWAVMCIVPSCPAPIGRIGVWRIPAANTMKHSWKPSA